MDLDQWASSDLAWQNGNLNGNNSRYPEGGIVPFRVAIEGLKAGNHKIHINYDFTAGGHKAYDFLATWNVTNASGKIVQQERRGHLVDVPEPAGVVERRVPIGSVRGQRAFGCRSGEIFRGSPTADDLGRHDHVDQPDRRISGSVNGNSAADFLVRFRSTGSAVLLAWGGHLAQSRYWDTAGGGTRDGASLVSGAPWHMRTLQLDGAGNKNQDRSIQPSAIVGELPPQALAPTPRPDASAAGRVRADSAATVEPRSGRTHPATRTRPRMTPAHSEPSRRRAPSSRSRSRDAGRVRGRVCPGADCRSRGPVGPRPPTSPVEVASTGLTEARRASHATEHLTAAAIAYHLPPDTARPSSSRRDR